MRRCALPYLIVPAVLGLAGCHRQAAEAPQATAAPAAEVAPAPAKEAFTVVRDFAGKAAPDATFDDLASGQPIGVAAFKGKPVLVNLWATWCGPCVRELPALDRIAAAKGGALAVVAVSQDMQGKAVVLPYLAKAGIKLHPYHDRDNALMLALKESELPVSILYGADGREKWRVRGGLDWTGAQARALLAEGGA